MQRALPKLIPTKLTSTKGAPRGKWRRRVLPYAAGFAVGIVGCGAPEADPLESGIKGQALSLQQTSLTGLTYKGTVITGVSTSGLNASREPISDITTADKNFEAYDWRDRWRWRQRTQLRWYLWGAWLKARRDG